MGKGGKFGGISTTQVDYINIGLIVISLIMAIYLPFKLFLFAYAVIGPLHYLTEINWIRDQKYFTKNKPWIWVAIGLAAFVMLPKIFLFGKTPDPDSFWTTVNNWTDSGILLALIIGVGAIFTKNNIQMLIVAAVGLVLAIVIQKVLLYHIIIGTFVPTLIHVYLFTILFMLYGAMKSNSMPGKFAALLVCLVPLFIFFVDIEPVSVKQETADTLATSGFHMLLAVLGKSLGTLDPRTIALNESAAYKLQVFISFAYLYHYLNWFSKTSIIGWHKKLNWKKTAMMAAVWIVSVGLFYYDYKVGITVLFGLSLLHVFLEFPVNAISIKGIVQKILAE